MGSTGSARSVSEYDCHVERRRKCNADAGTPTLTSWGDHHEPLHPLSCDCEPTRQDGNFWLLRDRSRLLQHTIILESNTVPHASRGRWIWFIEPPCRSLLGAKPR